MYVHVVCVRMHTGAVFEPRQADAESLDITRKRWEEATTTGGDKAWQRLVPVLAKITREVTHKGPFALLLPRLDELFRIVATSGSSEDDIQTYYLGTLIQQRIILARGGNKKSSGIDSNAHTFTEL